MFSVPDPFGPGPASEDPVATVSTDTIPVQPRFGNFVEEENTNPFDLKDPVSIEKNIEYDPETGLYIITEKIGDDFYRAPTYMTFEEYLEWSRRQQEEEYFKNLAGVSTGDNRVAGNVDPVDVVDIKESLIDRLFGGSEVDIKPQGNINLTFGGDYQRQDNPILLERQRRTGGFDFDMDIQVNVNGKIGEKLSTNFNYNTQSTFDFENRLKLDYDSNKFSEDDIIKKIEAGDVSLPLRGSLIQGSQNLFGVKTELQFGRLRLAAIASQQRSEKNDLTIQGGSVLQDFEVPIDDYDENRHFFLSHFNRETFDGALGNLPQINSLFRINRIEVWVTNDKNQTIDVRDIIAIADIGEWERMTVDNPERFESDDRFMDLCELGFLPTNTVNTILPQLQADSSNRFVENAIRVITGPEFEFQQTKDFEKVRARRLSPSEYNFHPELGFLSLNIRLRPDQVLGVAYEYTYNGKNYRVGELSDVVPVDPENQSLLYVKMLKSTNQLVKEPMFDLMMKNFYYIGGTDVNPENFELDVFFEDPGAGFKRFLPEQAGESLQNIPLITIFNLDNLNRTGDPQPDGQFDFAPGMTIYPRQGRIMFPVLEPFGSSLAEFMRQRGVPEDTIERFTYPMLYDSTKFRAQEFPEFNRFTIKGQSQSSSSSDISLGAFNIPPGSVRVTAGGQTLVENQDYIIDYNIGRLKILNDQYLQPGTPIRVSFEENALFSFQKKTMIGLRADYDVSKNLVIGGTYMHLFERPFTQKVNVGEDPINNRVYGLDVNYSNEAPWVTRLVDKIPFIDTKEPSNINFQAEVAALRPGHSRAIRIDRKDDEGVVYIDDFEGSASNFDLRVPNNAWQLASVPQGARLDDSPIEAFPESGNEFLDNTISGANRAKLNWYRIDRSIRTAEDRNNPYTRPVNQQEIFQNRTPRFGPNDFRTFDLTYYPDERGQYNFDPPEGYPGISGGLDENCKLRNPESRWGGIQRSLRTTDFEQANIEAIEFWMLNPFILDEYGSEGKLVINLGNVSEDVLKDSRLFYEHGLPRTPEEADTDTTNWSRIPKIQPVVNAFDVDVEAREAQDVGLDGFDDEGERVQFGWYIDLIKNANYPPECIAAIESDPANDNFIYFRDFPSGTPLLERYRNFNGMQGNSPPSLAGQATISAATNIPSSEDLNNDVSLSESESYYQYEINLQRDPTNPRRLNFNLPFITDSIVGQTGTWYRFRVPIDMGESVGQINDFRSIRFMRMYLTGFERQTTLRFATLDLVRSQWRRYTRSECFGDDVLSFEVDAVSIEENSARVPFPYVIPKGIQRERIVGSTFQDVFQNEQSLTMRFCGFQDGCDVRVFKILNLDMRVFRRLQMFVHAESAGVLDGDNIPDGDLKLFIRMGSDFENNYYEYEIPLKMSTGVDSADLQDEIWRAENDIDFALSLFTDLKIERNAAGVPIGDLYEKEVANEDFPEFPRMVRIKGNPTLGYVKNIMVGLNNPVGGDDNMCGEVWINELRVEGLDERGGVAALARMDMSLADFGTLGFSTTYSSIGYGAIDQRLDQRAKEEVFQLDISTGLQLGKFFGKDAGIQIPFYAQYSTTTRTPQFDPIDLDLDFKEKLKRIDDREERDSVRKQAIDYTALKSFSFTNVKKERKSQKKPMPWDISNFSVSYSYTKSEARNEVVERDDLVQHKASLDYNYTLPNLSIQPLKNLSKSKWLKPITELNLNPLPNSFSFRTIMDRRFGQRDYRFSDAIFKTWFTKRFTWDRDYTMRWDLTKSLKINFNATNAAVIDEPEEYIDREQLLRITDDFRRDSIWTNIKKFGRTKNYAHNVRASYSLPTKLFPLLDWIRADVSVDANYTWNAAALNADSLGNKIQNGQNRQFTADLDFTRLYSKSGYLSKIDGKPSRRSRSRGQRPQSGRDRNPAQQQQKDDKKRGDRDPGFIEKLLIRPLLTIRKFRFNYTRNLSTVVPGFAPQSQILGMNNFEAPGWDFVFGFQPDIARRQNLNEETNPIPDWLDGARNEGWLVPSAFQNLPVLQTETESIDGRLTLEPFPDFKIDVDANRSYSNNFSIFYKNTTKQNDGLQRLSPRELGSFSMSFFSMQTLFMDSEEEINALFKTFEAYRPVVSQDRGTGEKPGESAYAEGFGSKQRDIVVPAFISAYTDMDPESYDVEEVFDWLPRPNWQLTYNGLQKLPLFKELFSSVRITHGYKSTLNVNSFESNLNYVEFDEDNNFVGQQNEENFNPATNNYYSKYIIPAVSIDEQFSPLVGVEVKTQNDMNFSFNYIKKRGLRLGFTQYELQENRSTSIEFGFDFAIKNFEMPFGNKKKKKKEPEPEPPAQGQQRGGRGRAPVGGNNLEILLDVRFTDNITVNHYLDQESLPQPTRGARDFSISPAVRYGINKNVSLRFFFDYKKTTPYTTTGYPITRAEGGVTVQVTLQ